MKTVYIMPIIVEVRKTFDNQHYVIRRTGKIAFLHGCKKAVHPQRHYFSGFGFSFSALTQSPAFHPSAFCVITKQNYALDGEREFATQKILPQQNRKTNHWNKSNPFHCRKSQNHSKPVFHLHSKGWRVLCNNKLLRGLLRIVSTNQKQFKASILFAFKKSNRWFTKIKFYGIYIFNIKKW